MSLITSVLTGGPSNHTTSSEEVNAYATDFVSQGIVGSFSNTGGVAPATGAFAVNAQGTPDMTVAVSSGVAYVTATPSSQNSQKLRVRNSASTNVTISANSSGSTKYDWVYIKIDATNANTPNTAGDNVATLVTSRSSSASTDDGTPPTYGYCIAVVTVANGASSISNANIRDVRNLAVISATSTGQSQDWYASGYVPSSITANGNRSYTCVVNSADLTSFLSKGMRLRFTRTTSSPTQCTSLNGTTQYWVKTSPNKLTFTNNFVVSAWVRVSSYAASSVASRYNGTSGWDFGLNASGQVQLIGLNAGAANYKQVLSYQSVPLNKWVHITAQLDMTSSTTTGGTVNYVMIDGVDVPSVQNTAGTNPTALIQAGNLEIGSRNAGTQPFPGKIAQVAIYNAKVTQANVRATISQGLSGSETSLASAYSFNNSVTDLNTSTPNDLSVGGGAAVATNSDSPFSVPASGTPGGTYDYGIIQDISYSTNTTITVQVPEANAIPTTGGVSAMAYSTSKAPYGMPTQKGKWEVTVLVNAIQSAITIASPNVWTSLINRITVPVGDWVLSIAGTYQQAGTTITHGHILLAPATPTNAVRTYELTSIIWNGAAPTNNLATVNRSSSISLTTATDYINYADVATSTGATTTIVRGDLGQVVFKAENAYL